MNQAKNSSKKILIIGGGGYIGSWLTSEFKQRGHETVIIDYLKTYSQIDKESFNKIIKFRKENLLKDSVFYNEDYNVRGSIIIEEFRPDIVVHLASIPIDDPKNDVISRYQILDDTSLTESIVQTLRKVKVEKFVFLSSVFAYGDCDGWSTSETTVLNPKTPYGISKAVGEYIIKAYLDNWNIIRTTSVYGFGDSNLRATQIFINKALNNDNFWVNADTLLDFIYIKDLVGGIADVALSGFKKENFHITGGKALRLVDYVNEIKKYFPKIRYKVKIGLNDRPKRATMDNTKARILLGWEPKYSLAEGVRDYIKYSKKYKIG